MRITRNRSLWLSLAVVLPLAVGCNDDGNADADADTDADTDINADTTTDSGTTETSGGTETSSDTTGTTDTTDTGCTPGELNCACNGGLCLGDLECVDDVCIETCTAGELGCECNNGQCLGDFVCVGDLCTDPDCTPGELLCECNNGLCLGDLECVDNVCMEGGETTTDTDTDGGDCPNANEMLCDGVCIDVIADDDNCGECGNVCGTNSQAGGCNEGACDPFWSECVSEDMFTNCDELCTSLGQTCAANSCALRTFTTYGGGCNTFDHLAGTHYPAPCDAVPNIPIGTLVSCCCVD